MKKNVFLDKIRSFYYKVPKKIVTLQTKRNQRMNITMRQAKVWMMAVVLILTPV